MDLSPTSKIIKIEQEKFLNKGIDCDFPLQSHIMFSVTSPTVSNIYWSYVDSARDTLIIWGPKIFILRISSFVVGFQKGNDEDEVINQILDIVPDQKNNEQNNQDLEEAIKLSSPVTFEYPPGILPILTDLTFEEFHYFRIVEINKSEDSLFLHFFFVQNKMILVNESKGIFITKDLGINHHRFNQVQVCNQLPIIIIASISLKPDLLYRHIRVPVKQFIFVQVRHKQIQ